MLLCRKCKRMKKVERSQNECTQKINWTLTVEKIKDKRRLYYISFTIAVSKRIFIILAVKAIKFFLMFLLLLKDSMLTEFIPIQLVHT